jgi:hypothetical protein
MATLEMVRRRVDQEAVFELVVGLLRAGRRGVIGVWACGDAGGYRR